MQLPKVHPFGTDAEVCVLVSTHAQLLRGFFIKPK